MVTNRLVMVMTMLVCVLVIGSLGYYYYNANTQMNDQELVNKVFTNQPKVESTEFVKPAVKPTEGTVPKSQVKELVPSDKPVHSPKKDVISESKGVLSDADISKLWFDLRQNTIGKDEITTKVEQLYLSIATILKTGKTPSIVDKFPLMISELKDYGFSEAFYPYPNGSVHVIHLVMPQVVEDNKRSVLFMKVSVEGKNHVEVFRDLDVVPVNYAVHSGKKNYILVSGSRLNKDIFTSKEDTNLVAFEINTNAISVIRDYKFEQDLKLVKHQIDSGVIRLSVDDKKFTPYLYTEIIENGTLSREIYMITSDPNKVLKYGFGVKDEVVTIRYIGEVKS